jgi:adenylate kinase
MGPPGAGKGTQAKRLAAELRLPHVSTGDLLRDHQARDTAMGHKARPYLDAGELVPDELVLDMLFERVAAPDCAAGYVLDGFPRTTAQARALGARLLADAALRVVDLVLDDDEVVERLSGRRTCQSCGNTHHVHFSPPRIAGRCDVCGGELVQRSDDTPEVIQRRLQEYREKTLPTRNYYVERRLLTELDGSRSPDEVFRSLARVVRGEAA